MTTTPLLVLALFSLICGYLLKDIFVGLGTDFWGSSISVKASPASLVEFEFLPSTQKLFPVALSLSGSLFLVYLYLHRPDALYGLKMSVSGSGLYEFLSKRWYLDLLSNRLVVGPALEFGYRVTTRNLDRGFVDLFGARGASLVVSLLSRRMVYSHTGLLYNYLFASVLSVVGILLLLYPFGLGIPLASPLVLLLLDPLYPDRVLDLFHRLSYLLERRLAKGRLSRLRSRLSDEEFPEDPDRCPVIPLNRGNIDLVESMATDVLRYRFPRTFLVETPDELGSLHQTGWRLVQPTNPSRLSSLLVSSSPPPLKDWEAVMFSPPITFSEIYPDQRYPTF